jgi:hypothetical protein
MTFEGEGKGKSKDYPVLNDVPCYEDVWWLEVQLHAFLTSVLDGGVGYSSRLGCFTPIPTG